MRAIHRSSSRDVEVRYMSALRAVLRKGGFYKAIPINIVDMYKDLFAGAVLDHAAKHVTYVIWARQGVLQLCTKQLEVAPCRDALARWHDERVRGGLDIRQQVINFG